MSYHKRHVERVECCNWHYVITTEWAGYGPANDEHCVERCLSCSAVLAEESKVFGMSALAIPMPAKVRQRLATKRAHEARLELWANRSNDAANPAP